MKSYLSGGALVDVNIVSIVLISIIVMVLFVAIVINMGVTAKYKKILKELKEINLSGIEAYKTKFLNNIVSYYKEVYSKLGKGVNTQAIIESEFYNNNRDLLNSEKFLNNVNSIMLVLGISGTFYNLIEIAKSMAKLFETNAPSLESVLGDMSIIFSNLSIAFMTTFAGILASLLYLCVSSFNNTEVMRNSLLARLEDYLDNLLCNTMMQKQDDKEKSAQGENQNSNVLYMMENTANTMLETTTRIEESMSRLNDNLKLYLEKANPSEQPAVKKTEKEEPAVNPKEFEKENQNVLKKEEPEHIEIKEDEKKDVIYMPPAEEAKKDENDVEG